MLPFPLPTTVRSIRRRPNGCASARKALRPGAPARFPPGVRAIPGTLKRSDAWSAPWNCSTKCRRCVPASRGGSRTRAPTRTCGRRRDRGFPRLARTGGIAAALLLGLAAWWWSAGPRPSPSQHYTTDEIAQRSVALADGSLMDVNVDSDVVVQYTPRERRVYCTKVRPISRSRMNLRDPSSSPPGMSRCGRSGPCSMCGSPRRRSTSSWSRAGSK